MAWVDADYLTYGVGKVRHITETYSKLDLEQLPIQRTYYGFDRNFSNAPPYLILVKIVGVSLPCLFAADKKDIPYDFASYLCEHLTGAEIVGVYKLV